MVHHQIILKQLYHSLVVQTRIAAVASGAESGAQGATTEANTYTDNKVAALDATVYGAAGAQGVQGAQADNTYANDSSSLVKVEVIELRLETDEIIAPVVSYANTQVDIESEHAKGGIRTHLPTVDGIVPRSVIVVSRNRLVSLSVSPGVRIGAPLPVVVNLPFRFGYLVVTVVLVNLHAVIETEGRHGHGVNHKATEWHPVVAVTHTDVALLHIDAADVTTKQYHTGVLIV